MNGKNTKGKDYSSSSGDMRMSGPLLWLYLGRKNWRKQKKQWIRGIDGFLYIIEGKAIFLSKYLSAEMKINTVYNEQTYRKVGTQSHGSKDSTSCYHDSRVAEMCILNVYLLKVRWIGFFMHGDWEDISCQITVFL